MVFENCAALLSTQSEMREVLQYMIQAIREQQCRAESVGIETCRSAAPETSSSSGRRPRSGMWDLKKLCSICYSFL